MGIFDRLKRGDPAPKPLGAEANKRRPPAQPSPMRRRRFLAADSTDLLRGWDDNDFETYNSRLYYALETLRARARAAERDDPFARGFIAKAIRNVVGNGFTCKPKTGKDGMDEAVLEAVKMQSYSRNFAASGNISRVMFERLVVNHLVRDGEVFVQRLRHYRRNETHYTLRLIDPSRLFTQYLGGGRASPSGAGTMKQRAINENTGNRIVLGVEVDGDYRPVAYHFHTGDRKNDTAALFTYHSGEILRIPADDILHLYLPTYANQVRGVTWLHSVLAPLEELRRYHKSAIIAARQGAAKHLAVISPDGAGYSGDEDEELIGGGVDAASEDYEMDFTGEKINQFSHGTNLQFFDPKYPHEMYRQFVDKRNELLATGLDAASPPLSNNWEGINFSAGQLMMHDDRDKWKSIQQFIAEEFHAWWYDDFIKVALLRGLVKTPDGAPLMAAAYDDIKSPEWLGKQFAPVDAVKASTADAIMIKAGVKSRAECIREMGKDPKEVFAEIKEEEKQFGLPAPDAPGTVDSGFGEDDDKKKKKKDGAAGDE